MECKWDCIAYPVCGVSTNKDGPECKRFHEGLAKGLMKASDGKVRFKMNIPQYAGSPEDFKYLQEQLRKSEKYIHERMHRKAGLLPTISFEREKITGPEFRQEMLRKLGESAIRGSSAGQALQEGFKYPPLIGIDLAKEGVKDW